MPRLLRLLVPGARVLALFSLFAFSGCSRAEKPQAESPASPAPAAEAAPAPVVPQVTSLATNEAQASVDAPTLLAAAPHPTEGTNNPDAVIHSPVPVPSGATLHVLVPEGQNPPWLADVLAKAIGAKVEIGTYATDAEAVALVAGNPAADLVSIPDQAAAPLIARNALRPLGEATKGLAEPAPEFLHHYFDNKSVYTWPYGYTLLGFAYVAPAEAKAFVPRTWRDLARPDLAPSFPADPQLKGALWALAEAKPALSDTPPESWQKAQPLAAPGNSASKLVVDALPRLRALKTPDGKPWQVALPPEGSLIFLYHWAIPAASAQAPLAEAAFRALADPATAARLDADADLAATQPAAKALVPAAQQADPLLYPHETVLTLSRFVRAPAPAAEASPSAPAAAPAK